MVACLFLLWNPSASHSHYFLLLLLSYKVIHTFSNLHPIGEEDGTYISAEDPDYVDGDDLTEAMSDFIGMKIGGGGSGGGFGFDDDDDYTYDTVTVGYRSAAYDNKKIKHQQVGRSSGEDLLFKSPTKKGMSGGKVHGNTTVSLPYIVDLWRDSKSQARVSVQVHMMSGVDFHKGVGVRVSTSKSELVLTFPMSTFMARAESAFATSFFDGKNFNNEHEKHCMHVIMKHHGKTVARMVSVSKVKGRSTIDEFLYHQRIPLPHRCKHNFPSQIDGDDFFHGQKFIQYPDGSIQLHVELLCETADGYHPEEVASKPATHIASPANIPAATASSSAATAAGNGSTQIPSPGAVVFNSGYDGAGTRPRSVKRQCTYQDSQQQQQNGVATDDDAEYDEYTVYTEQLEQQLQQQL
jgi:hypothetical protein